MSQLHYFTIIRYYIITYIILQYLGMMVCMVCMNTFRILRAVCAQITQTACAKLELEAGLVCGI